MMLIEDNLVKLLSKGKNDKVKMTGLTIKQYITNSVIKTEVIQRFEYQDSFFVLFKDNPNRKKLKIHLGEKLLKSKLEERVIFAQQENVIVCKDKQFSKFQDYKMIELTKIPMPEGDDKEITVSFSEVGSVLSKYSCMYYNILRTFSKEFLEDLTTYNLYIYLKLSSKIDFLKAYSKAQTTIIIYSDKRGASITQNNLKTMEDIVLYYRHENINQPSLSFGKEKGRQTILMIDYLPPFNPVKDFSQCIKSNSSSSQHSDSELQLESVEFCIVVDKNCKFPEREFDRSSMRFLINQALSKIEKTIKSDQSNQLNEQNEQSRGESEKLRSTTYINFSYLDESGWDQQYLRMKENTIEQHQIIKNQFSPKIEWKGEESDFLSFLDNFTLVKNTLNIPRVLILISQCKWRDFDQSIVQLKQLRSCINENRPFISASTSANQKSVSIQEKPNDNQSCSNILDMFFFYYGDDNYGQEELKSALTSKRFFTRQNIDTPEFPQQDLLYQKKHSDFYLDVNRENVEYSTIPLYLKVQEQKSNIQVKYNEIFQQFVFLQYGTNNLKGNLRYFDGRSRQYFQVPIDFSRIRKKGQQQQILESDDVAMAGLFKLFQSNELVEQRELMKNMSILNHIHSPITQEVFCIQDINNSNYSSDSSVKEITPFISAANQQNKGPVNSFSSRLPSVVRYEAPKSDLLSIQKAPTNPQNSQPSSLSSSKSKVIISELLSKNKEVREQKQKEKNKILNFDISQKQQQSQSMERVKTLVNSQELSGCWKYNENILSMLKYSKDDFFLLKRRISHRSEPHLDSLIMTSIILIEFKMQFSGFYKYWESSQVKSTNWIDENFEQSIYIKTFRITRELHDDKQKKKKKN